MAWLWAFLAFLALAVVSIRREVPVFLPPPAAEAGAVSQTPSPESAAVLPFSETLTASPYAVGLDIGKPTERPEALRREPDGSLVCELGAGSNHLGGLDGGLWRGLWAMSSRPPGCSPACGTRKGKTS